MAAFPERLILFDIDCTLVDAHGAGGRAILQAIAEVYGLRGEVGDYSFHGRTDPEIVLDLVRMWGGDGRGAEDGAAAGGGSAAGAAADGLLGRCLARYVELLEGEVARGRVEVLPGVKELVTALAADRRALVGLLTGNVAEGARIKLGPTGLWPLFRVGAFGSDSAVRGDLPPLAVARAEALSGRRFRGKEVVVVGDTPADIECGRPLGVKAVAVATGRHSPEELAAHGPDHVFADFSDWQAAYAAMLA